VDAQAGRKLPRREHGRRVHDRLRDRQRRDLRPARRAGEQAAGLPRAAARPGHRRRPPRL